VCVYTHTHTYTKNLLRVLQCSRILSYAFFRLAFTKIPVNGDPVAFLGLSPPSPPPPLDGQSCSSTVI
jgi:hypothetical protein